MKSKSHGVVIKEVLTKKDQETKKHNAGGVLKHFKKLKAQSVEELSNRLKVIDEAMIAKR